MPAYGLIFCGSLSIRVYSCLFVVNPSSYYLGRLAPSPTGLLHLGHARTFWTAQERARAAHATGSGQASGELLLRNDDLDAARCRPEFVTAMLEDLRWFGLQWTEPVVTQSRRLALYRAALARLHALGCIYPCSCSRRDVQQAATAPHELTDEPLYPGTCRPENLPPGSPLLAPCAPAQGDGVNWRFHVPDGEPLAFTDGRTGPQHAVAGRDFGDFLVWRKDDTPSYQLACVVDDAAMSITEVVRGADLQRSTFRQLLLYRALGLAAPAFYHCPLFTDEKGVRLAKRHDALALRTLRELGRTPEEIRSAWL
jgi:glutamyl/glutaminyl-tRNA synthetase